MAPGVSTPVVTTIHNDFTPERRTLYTQHAEHRYVAISAAQARRWLARLKRRLDGVMGAFSYGGRRGGSASSRPTPDGGCRSRR